MTQIQEEIPLIHVNNNADIHEVPTTITNGKNVHSYDSTAPISNTIKNSNASTNTNNKIRDIAISLSLYANIAITLIKLYTYIQTSSLSVLATLVDSVLDVCSQAILAYAEYKFMRSSDDDSDDDSYQRSNELFPSGASRVEPISVLICSALMGMASFEVIKESITDLSYHIDSELDDHLNGRDMSSVWQMVFIVFLKLFLMQLCQISIKATAKTTKTKDGTMEALKLDHVNDCLSNLIAALALLAALSNKSLWFLDPFGAIAISIYIIWSWYNTGREQITHLSGIAAPSDFVQEICTKVEQSYQKNDDNTNTSTFDIDWCRAYHFGPKYLVEMEIVLPPDTILKESHDLGMKLQYFIESMDDVERCFVHMDYESREYDEHVVSKIYGPDEVERKFLLKHSVTV